LCAKGKTQTGIPEGERLLASVIGTESFRKQYIKNKVKDWVKDFQLPSDLVRTQGR